MTMATMAMTAVIVLRSHVVSGLRGALTPEELLQLGHPDALPLLARDVQAVLVDQHLRVFEPLPPGGLGDGVEDLLSELTLERGLLQTFGLLTQLDALNGSRHEAGNLAARWPPVNLERAPSGRAA